MQERMMSTTQSIPAAFQSSGPVTSDARGDVTLLNHPIAQELLQSTLLARLAYIALDGTPRVVPLQFHWTGEELVINSWPDDPKVAALRANPQVAVTIDGNDPPFRALQLRGTASVTVMDGVSAEMHAASARYMGPAAGQEWVATVMRLSPQSARIAIRPTWVDVLDFTTRLPGGMARRIGRT
jgi:PPOX class probable F420-dependent enzyme